MENPLAQGDAIGSLTRGTLHGDDDRFAVLRHIFDVFADSMTVSLSAQLRNNFMFRMRHTERQCYEDVRATFQRPCCLVELVVTPLQQPAVLVVDGVFAKTIVELLLGGQPESQEDVPVGGNLTEIEQNLFLDIAVLIAAEITAALSRIGDFAVQFKLAPEMFRGFPTRDLVDLVWVDVRLGESVWPMKICLPAAIADSTSPDTVRSDTSDTTATAAGNRGGHNSGHGAAAAVDPAMMSAVVQAEVEFEARSRGPTLPLAVLAALRPGDILHFRHLTSDKLSATVNGHPQFSGHVVVSNRRRAFVIDE
jgi:flagellar motor switch protein FliM